MIPTRMNRLGAGLNRRTTWQIRHGAGVLDINITGTTNLLWKFPDGSTSTAPRPAKTVTKGTTIITCDDFSANGVNVYIYGASSALASYPIPIKSLPALTYRLSADANGITGKVADLPRVTNYLYLYDLPNLTGTVAGLPRVTNYLNLTNLSGLTGTVADLPRVTNNLYLVNLSGLTGTTADLPRVTNYLNLNGLSGLTGTVADLPRVTNTLYLYNLSGLTGTVADLPRVTNNLHLYNLSGLTGTTADLPANAGTTRLIVYLAGITGALPVVPTNTDTRYYGNSQVTPAEYDQTIANCVAAGGAGGTLYISSRRTSASDADVATLRSRGWTVNDSNI